MQCISCKYPASQFRVLAAIASIAIVSLAALASEEVSSRVTALTEPTPASGDAFGESSNSNTSLSADGRTALIAAPEATVGATFGAGKAYIYSNSGDQWSSTAEFDDPDAAAGNLDVFGIALALNSNGTVALIGSGASVNGQLFAGKAYVFTLSNGTWTQSHEFDDPDAAASDGFGFSGVALSADGKTAVIGANGARVNGQSAAGKAYVFTQVNGIWTQTVAISDPDAPYDEFADEFGSQVAVSGDGRSALVGSVATVNGQTSAGKAHLYTLSNGSWVQSHEFDDPASLTNDYFGFSGVGLSSNGRTAIIGAFGTAVDGRQAAGKAYIFTKTGGNWTQTIAISDPDHGTPDVFGHAVTISADGKSALIGSQAAVNGQSAAGKAYLYTLSIGNWALSRAFSDPAATAGDSFGGSVTLSRDGKAAFISAPYTTVNNVTTAGEAYIYLLR